MIKKYGYRRGKSQVCIHMSSNITTEVYSYTDTHINTHTQTHTYLYRRAHTYLYSNMQMLINEMKYTYADILT